MFHRHFESLAVGLLAECYIQDEKRAGLMLVRELDLFGKAVSISPTLVLHERKKMRQA